MTKVVHNGPGAPVNQPQHLVGDEGNPPNPISGQVVGAAPQSAPHEGPQGMDATDPHPAEEGHPYDSRHPGCQRPSTKDIGPNPAAHNGSAPRRPHNAGSGAE